MRHELGSVRRTVEIPADVYRVLLGRAEERGVTVSAVINAILERSAAQSLAATGK